MTDSAIAHLHEAWAELTAPGGAFALEEAEVGGIPMRVFSSAMPSMRTVWETAVGTFGDRSYVVYEDERYAYDEIAAQVRALAHLLRDTHGIGRGDRVALAMRNYPEWVVGYWATLAVGAAVVGMNAWWTTPEMEYALSDSRPKVLIADDERLERALPVLDGLRATAPMHVISVRSGRPLPADASRWTDVVVSAAAPAALPDAEIDPDDDATIFYTSGTTGFPKGAQLTHRGCVHNILHLVFWAQVGARAAAKDAAALGVAPTPPVAPAGPAVFMAPTPLFHVTACNCLLHPATLGGGTIVLTRKWDAGRALELIEREGVTNFSGVPTMSREILAHPDFAKRDTSTLLGLAGGGAPVPPDLVAKIDKALPKGAPGTGYGLTETCGIVTANGARFYLAKPASCGPVVPTLEAKLVDEEGNDVLADPQARGELCVRGPNVIKGYLNRPDATAEAIRDGWFHTGDIARIDEDGFVFIVDRAKDMVLRGGENVSCPEVEAAVYTYPGVVEAAVFAIPDERLGEAVAVAVVVSDLDAFEVTDLTAHLETLIAAHKVPSTVILRTDLLPRNANGKFLKRQLRDDYLASKADASA